MSRSEAPAVGPQEILDFWFGCAGQRRIRNAAQGLVDQGCRVSIAPSPSDSARPSKQALRGELDAWAATPSGALARILLLDQFTRNAFRGDRRRSPATRRRSPRRARSSARARTKACGRDARLRLPAVRACGKPGDAGRGGALFTRLAATSPEQASACSTMRTGIAP
jgi:uncharacterized protein (DUF924 family)